MAEAFKCDRCGGFFTAEDHADNKIKYRVMDITEAHPLYCNNGVCVHLCPNCSKALHTWMEYKDEPKTHTVYLKDVPDVFYSIHTPCVDCPKTFVKEKKKRWWRK